MPRCCGVVSYVLSLDDANAMNLDMVIFMHVIIGVLHPSKVKAFGHKT